jgi:hypothetical protein
MKRERARERDIRRKVMRDALLMKEKEHMFNRRLAARPTDKGDVSMKTGWLE